MQLRSAFLWFSKKWDFSACFNMPLHMHCHLPTQLWEAVSKKHAKINSKKNKASSFEQYSSFYFASPQTKPWSLMTPSLNKSTFSEWISLGCQTCPLPSWAHWRNNSGIELRFVLILTMVFKVISLNNSPCLWSVQVPCRCLAHPPISLDVLLYRLWFKFVLPVIIWSNFTRYGLFLCRPAPDDYIVRLCWFPWHTRSELVLDG